jgi:hypothetical protein
MRRKKMEEEPFCDWRLLAEPRRCPTPRPLDPAVPRTPYCAVAPLLRSRLGSFPICGLSRRLQAPRCFPTDSTQRIYVLCLFGHWMIDGHLLGPRRCPSPLSLRLLAALFFPIFGL